MIESFEAATRPRGVLAGRSGAHGVPSNRLLESVLAAFKAIRANKVRAILTALGIMIGVMNVVAMVALISGINASVLDLFRSMGTNTFTVTKMPASNVNYEQYLEYIRRPDFTYADAEAVEGLCPAVEAVSPQAFVLRKVKRGPESTRSIGVMGVTPEYQYVSDSAVGDGRFFAWPEADRRRQVVVLGAPVAEHLFPGGDPIGQDVLVGSRRFRVVGVMEPMGELFGQNLDDYVIVPYKTLNKVFGERLMTRLAVKAKSSERIDEAMDQVTRVLRTRRGLRAGDDDNFEIITQEQLVEMYENLTNVTWIVMIGISAIALVVGGVGIMNIMMVSVTERTREIGIRKAVGARSRDVLTQFLVESAVLSGLGGILGLVAAFGLARLVSSVTPMPATIELWSVFLAIGVSVTVGVFFGLYPASKAARMDPIVALRYE
ncbi:MAG: ABC transporter permease [Candidatus Eisenbacteria bacterium]|nr:ABC transporter permease [Candidatus Eisenbacteria bacterium]